MISEIKNDSGKETGGLYKSEVIEDVMVWLAATCLFIMFACSVPMIIPLYLIAYLYRTIVAFEIRRRFSNQGPSEYPCGQLLHPKDVFALGGKDSGQTIIGAIIVLDRLPNTEFVKKEIFEKIIDNRGTDGKVRFPKFRMCLDSWFGLYFWKYDNNFDYDNHFQICDTDFVGEAQCRTAITEAANQPIPNTRPCWEVVMFKFKDSESDHSEWKCVLLFRSSHMYANGVSLLRVMMDTHFFDENNQLGSKRLQEAVTKLQATQKISLSKKVLFVLKAVFFAPYILIYTALTGDKQHALHRNKMASDHSFQLTWSDRFPVEIMTPIREANKCSVNDIYLSCLVGALRRHFVAKNSEIPSQCNFCIPISTESLLKPPQLQNESNSLIVARLPLDISDPIRRLETIRRIMEKKKNSPEYLINQWWPNLIMNTLPNWLTHEMLKRADVTAISSNVPGPRFKLRALDSNIMDMMPYSQPVDKTGMFVTLLSQNYNCRMLMSVYRNLVPSQDRLDQIGRYFLDEIKLLQQLCNSGTK